MELYHQRLRSEHGMTDLKTREAAKCRGDNDASWAGYEEGKKAKLHHGVNGKDNQPLGIGR
jgi:hypothetical protein